DIAVQLVLSHCEGLCARMGRGTPRAQAADAAAPAAEGTAEPAAVRRADAARRERDRQLCSRTHAAIRSAASTRAPAGSVREWSGVMTAGCLSAAASAPNSAGASLS